MTLPSILVIAATLIFFALERMFPGRKLARVRGWYLRAALLNGAQLGITLATARVWTQLFDVSLFKLSHWEIPIAEGFVGWFVGTFFFYWWHVLRQKAGFWQIFHQIHHSPSRIELATSFYKHPIEIVSDSILSAVVLYPLLGTSMMGAFWYNFFAATGEYFYHANVRTPHWLRYLIQTRSSIRSITSTLSTGSISRIFHFGTVCLAATGIRPSLRCVAGFLTARKRSSAQCCCSRMCTRRNRADSREDLASSSVLASRLRDR